MAKLRGTNNSDAHILLVDFCAFMQDNSIKFSLQSPGWTSRSCEWNRESFANVLQVYYSSLSSNSWQGTTPYWPITG
jgi:hypothetical protein